MMQVIKLHIFFFDLPVHFSLSLQRMMLERAENNSGHEKSTLVGKDFLEYAGYY